MNEKRPRPFPLGARTKLSLPLFQAGLQAWNCYKWWVGGPHDAIISVHAYICARIFAQRTLREDEEAFLKEDPPWPGHWSRLALFVRNHDSPFPTPAET